MSFDPRKAISIQVAPFKHAAEPDEQQNTRNDTEHLLSTEANTTRLMESIRCFSMPHRIGEQVRDRENYADRPDVREFPFNKAEVEIQTAGADRRTIGHAVYIRYKDGSVTHVVDAGLESQAIVAAQELSKELNVPIELPQWLVPYSPHAMTGDVKKYP